MNYEKHYTLLIEKGKVENNSDKVYYEKHHIVPRCMGGTDDETNLVKLLPEQHCLAHLLLVKMYPEVTKLVYAANTLYNVAKNNKQYGWIKRKFSENERLSKTGVPRSKESCIKQSETLKQQYQNGKVNNATGTTISDWHKEQISKANLGKEIPIKSRSSLEGYILRFGEVEGLIRYKQDSLKKSITLESMILKYGVEIGTSKYNKLCETRSSSQKGSNNAFFNKTHSEETKQLISQKQKENSGSRGKIWVNNGNEAFRVSEDEIPEGFVRGRGSRKSKSPQT